MTATSSFGATGAQHTGMTTSVCTVFTCKQTEISIIAFTPTTAATNARSVDGPCNAPVCRQKFVNKMRSELELASMNCESALRKFSMVEPMLGEELTMAGCSSEMVEALLNCAQRSAATAKYLGHQSALSTLVQHKLLAMQSAVLRLSMNFFPAPGHAFPMIQGITSYERGWGKTELATLKSTDEGLAILTLPMIGENILAAKSSILRAQTELATLQATERAAFFADYPGTEALFASGAMKSTQEMLADMESQKCMLQGVSNMAIDVNDTQPLVDIRSLRPVRVGSKKMAANDLDIDMAAVRAYSDKPYTDLTNPW